MSNRSPKAQAAAINESLETMLEWYVSVNPEVEPVVAVDKKSYRGIVLRWMEPIVPHQDNPLLIEEQLGDYWTLRMEPFSQTSFKIG